MKPFLFYCLFIFLLSSCQKDKHNTLVIKGRLLQSSSNPVPVVDYKLSFYQAGNPNEVPIPIIGPSSAAAVATTNATGYFESHLFLSKGSFFGIPTGTNDNSISVSGTTKANVPLTWFGLNAISQDLQTVYLYKKIARAIVQVVSPTGIVPADTLYVSAFTVKGYYSKIITGLQASQNVAATIDTLTDAVFTGYSFTTSQYGGMTSLLPEQNTAVIFLPINLK